MTRTKISIADVNRLLQLYDTNANMNVNDQQNRSNLSSILTKIGFYGQRNNVKAVEQAINAVVSRNIYMYQSKAATVIQNHVREWFNQREQQRLIRKEQIQREQEQLQKQRELDIKELRDEFDPQLLDEEGIFDPERYRQQQHQLRAQEIEERKRKQDEDRQARQAQFLDGFHNVEDMNIDILFETDQQEISDYIRTHEKYVYHHLNTDNDVIMLYDIQNEAQFNRIKNIALNRYNKETGTLSYKSYNLSSINQIKPTKQYYRNIASQVDLDKHLDSVYDKEKGNVFKLAVDFGVLIERSDGNNEDQTIKYKYMLPVDASSERRAPLEIWSRDNISMYKQYLRTVVGSMQERTNTDTHEKIVSIFSIMLFIFRYPLAGAAIPSLKQHIKRIKIYYVDCKVNLCFLNAYSFITMPNSKDKRWKDCSRIAEAKRIFSRVNGVEFRDNYQGFYFVRDIDNFINKEQVNVHMYTFEDDPPHYELTQNYLVNGSDKQLNILFINDEINAHTMYISDVEALTGFRYCNICHRQAFTIGDKNLQVQMRNHMKKCQKNEGKIIKKVFIEKFAKPFVPHILSNKTYKYLLANNLTELFKPTRYYITYDIETLEKKVNEKFGDSSQVTATLIPYAIASTINLASDIHSFYYDIRTEYFLDKLLEQVFEEAKQVKKDNKYIDETIPQYFEIPVIGFNSAKFDASILFKNLKSKDWTISKMLQEILGMDRIKKKLSEDKYKEYLVEAAKHKQRWDYLKHYNILDTRVLIEPIDYLIELMFKYNVDMLANISMSQCCNAIKYSMNRPTLDRIDNSKGHSKDNVIPCCLNCNVCKANRDEKQMKLMIQLRKYALFKQLPMTLTRDERYQLLCKGIIGGTSKVMHRYNIAGETRINRFEFDQENKCVYSIDSDYVMTHVVQLDFHSQCPSVMNGEPSMLNPYTNHIIYMPAQLIEKITDQDRCKALIYDQNRFSEDPLVVDKMLLFVAEIKGHIDEKYLNEVINWGSILRNIDITTNKETIGEFMYNYLVNHQLPHDKTERKLTNLVDTNNELMSFNNCYLWLLMDTCHLVIDEIVSVTTFTKHTNFNSFVKEFMNLRQQAKNAKNEGLGQFCKLILNSAFGGDALNSEKYSNTRLLSANKTFIQHMLGGFIHTTELNEDLYAVQVDRENYRCDTYLQVAYFVPDSAKFWNVNFIYNFMNKAYDMSRMHFVQRDTDSLTWAISDNPNRGPDQLFEEVIKDQEFFDRYKDCVFSENGKKQILHIGVEKYGYNCIALSPKNCIINDEIVLKGVILDLNPQINEQTLVDCINKKTITTAINTTLAQRKGTMSRLKLEKNAITGSHTKMIALLNQSCLPFINNIRANSYFIKQ
ncbi:MAG: hypothetical protein EZS28_005858 [Streblomastix strix]|uniref:DNA-directed DNA polymerase n=1 Tax=Streblomastix strix TaxID=222440 RepID=A0A5J4WUY9_9EUKA|nr:MAG: hypothetical protein EZS28_005858 [Streblomastix strix]